MRLLVALLVLPACQQVFGVTPVEDIVEEEAPVTVRIIADQVYVHDTAEMQDVPEPVPMTSGEMVSEARTGDDDLVVPSSFVDGALQFELPLGASYRAHIGDIELHGIAGIDDVQTAGFYIAGRPTSAFPGAGNHITVSEVPPLPTGEAVNLVTTGLWQRVLQAQVTNISDFNFRFSEATRLTAYAPPGIPQASEGDHSFLVKTKKLGNDTTLEAAWVIPDGSVTVGFNVLGAPATQKTRCIAPTFDIPEVLAGFAGVEHRSLFTSDRADLEINITPRTEYFVENYPLVKKRLVNHVVPAQLTYLDPFARNQRVALSVYSAPLATFNFNLGVEIDVDIPLDPDGACVPISFTDPVAVASVPALDGQVLATDGVAITLDAPLVDVSWHLVNDGPVDTYSLVIFDVTQNSLVPVRTIYTRESQLRISSSLFATNRTYQLVIYAIAGIPGAESQQYTAHASPMVRMYTPSGRFTINR